MGTPIFRLPNLPIVARRSGFSVDITHVHYIQHELIRRHGWNPDDMDDEQRALINTQTQIVLVNQVRLCIDPFAPLITMDLP